MRKLTVILCIVFVLVLSLGAVLVIRWVQEIPPEVAAAADMRAAQSDAAGVDPGSSFVLTFPEQVSAASVRRCLSVSPDITVGLHQGASRNEVLVVPAEPLEPGRIYSFSITADGEEFFWSFAVKKPLSIVSASPAEYGLAETDQPLRIVLDQLVTLDLDTVGDHVTIEPQTDGIFSQQGRTLLFTPDGGWQPGTVYRANIAPGLTCLDSSITLEQGMSLAFETMSPRYSDAAAVFSGATNFLSGERPSFSVQLSASRLAEINAAAAAVAAAEGDSAQLNAQLELDRLLTVDVQLYKFSTAEDYADALVQAIYDAPSWSRAFVYLTHIDLEQAELRSTMKLRLRQRGEDWLLEWPTAPAAGYYVLRVFDGNNQRDLPFCLSELDAYHYADSSSTLLWLHDSVSGAALSASVTDVASGAVAVADAAGVAQLKHSGAAVYLVEAGERSLVLPQWQAAAESGQNDQLWRYLYLDQDSYASGAALHYFGLVRPRDGSALEYERLSLYIYAEGQTEPVYFAYTPLDGYVFSGELTLPLLQSGRYRLELWQSGRELIGRDFYIGDIVETEQLENAANTPVLPELELDHQGNYALGSSFAASFHQGEGEYLFVERSHAVERVSVSERSLYLSAFQPENQLNTYLSAVYYHDGYTLSAPSLLALDAEPQRLQVDLTAPQRVLAGERGDFTLTVTDSSGAAVPNASVALTVTTGDGQPHIDPWAEIYTDYTLLPGAPAAAVSRTYAGETLSFAVYVTDEQGQVSGSFPTEDASGAIYVAAQALAADSQVVAGSATQLVVVGAQTQTTPKNVQPVSYTEYTSATAFTGSGSDELILLTGAEQGAALALLLDAAISPQDTTEAALASAQAVRLLGQYGGEMLAEMLAYYPDQALRCQMADGSIGRDLRDARAALFAAPAVDASALASSLRALLEDNDDAALGLAWSAGLAAVDDSGLLSLEQWQRRGGLKTTDGQLWAALGHFAAQDERPAAQLLADLDAGQLSTVRQQALYAAALAYDGQTEAALALLQTVRSRARLSADYLLEQVFVAQKLLENSSCGAADFAYRIDGEDFSSRLAENGVFTLPVAEFSGSFAVTELPEGHVWLRVTGEAPAGAPAH